MSVFEISSWEQVARVAKDREEIETLRAEIQDLKRMFEVHQASLHKPFPFIPDICQHAYPGVGSSDSSSICRRCGRQSHNAFPVTTYINPSN